MAKPKSAIFLQSYAYYYGKSIMTFKLESNRKYSSPSTSRSNFLEKSAINVTLSNGILSYQICWPSCVL